MNIPEPNRGRKRIYQFDTLEIGERLQIPDEPKAKTSATQAAYHYGKKSNKVFKVRTLTDGNFVYRES